MGDNWVIEKMKKRIWITAGSMLASLVLIIVACTKEKEPEKPAIPTAPTGLSVTFTNAYENAAGGYVARFSFSWNEVKDADYYDLYYSKNSSGPYEQLNNGHIYTTIYKDSGFIGNSLDEDIDYYVKVTAGNESGTSSMSNYVYCHYSYNGGGGSSTISAPSGVSAEVSGSRVCVTWNSVSNASYYRVYRASSSSGSYSMLESSSNTYYYDASPNFNNYYKVTAVNASGTESDKSDYAYCYYSNGGGGGGTTVPNAPTGVTAVNTGPVQYPSICISWNAVSNATSYKVYRSTSASGSYSQIGFETSYTTLYDDNPKQGYNYYKVKAFNSAGGSSYSSYAVYNHDPSSQLSPCPVHYTSHTATSSTITLRWSNPTTSGCGTPTKAYLRVRHPDLGDYIDLQTLSGSTTSVSFNYLLYVSSDGYVYCGIITENSAGTSGGLPVVYNVNTGAWYGGNGLELEGFMEQSANGF